MSDHHAHSLLDPALLERIKGLALVARRVVEGILHGLHRSPLHGLSIEFAQHRQYTPGDELKHLDWRVLGRSDRYVIKQFEQETNMRVVVLVDCSRSMAYGAKTAGAADGNGRRSGGDGAGGSAGPSPNDTTHGMARLHAVGGDGDGPEGPSGSSSGVDAARSEGRGSGSLADSKYHYARTLAAALAYLLLRQGDSVGLMLTNYRIVAQLAPRAAPGHILGLCQILERMVPDGITDLSTMLGQLAARLKRRSLVILVSDLLDNPEQVLAGLGQLAHRGHEVIVFQVLDPRELTFDLGLAGYGVTVIRDMETGEEFEAEPQLIRDLVRGEIGRFCERLDAGARAHGLHLVRCRTSDPVEQVLTRYLNSRVRGRRR